MCKIPVTVTGIVPLEGMKSCQGEGAMPERVKCPEYVLSQNSKTPFNMETAMSIQASLPKGTGAIS